MDADLLMSTTATAVKERLAIDGGTPVRTRPWAPWPEFSADEVETAAAVLRSGKVNYWTGEEGREFEKQFAAFVGRKYAVALANGTLALELALYALGIGPGDQVIVPSRTFVATATCVLLRGATPVFADVDRDSGNLTAATVEPLITRRTRAIIPVHLAGWPCDMDPILALARKHRLKVIEDCAQAHGATYKGRPVGSLGDLAAFSFCQDKIVSTGGEGGMLLTDDRKLWERAWSYKDHGKSYQAVYRRKHAPGFRWLHESPGTNWRLTEMQSALGRVLLHKIAGRVAARRRHAAILSAAFATLPALRVTPVPPAFGHAFYKYHVFVRPERLARGWSRTRVQEAIAAEGVPCLAGSCSEIYLEKMFPKALRPKQRLPVARELGETSLMFQVHHTLTEEDMRDTVRAVTKVLKAATRAPGPD